MSRRATSSPRCWRRSPRGRRDRGALPEGAAPRRRLQSRRAAAGGRADNLAHLLVGSEGTLGISTAIELKLSPLPRRRRSSASATSRASARRWRRRGISSRWADLGRAGRSDDDRAARRIDMFCRRWRLRAGRSGCLLLVEFADDGGERGEPRGAGRRDERPRLRLRPRRRRGRRRRIARREAAGGIAELRAAGLNIMMSMKGERKAGLLRRGLRGAAGASGRLHRPADGDLREARHARHLVRPRFCGLPARAPGPQHEARQGRADHARDRRGGVRDGARLQGLAFGRARRRASCARNSTSRCSASGSCAPSRR